MPRKLDSAEDTVPFQIRMPASLKRQAMEAAKRYGDGDLSSWLRGLIRAECQRLGVEVPAAEEKAKPRARKKETR